MPWALTKRRRRRRRRRLEEKEVRFVFCANFVRNISHPYKNFAIDALDAHSYAVLRPCKMSVIVVRFSSDRRA
jgi:hypothetical protein